MSRNKKRVLAIGDQHFPFAHKDTIAFLRRAKKDIQPHEVVNMGDELDFHALSDYDHDPDGYSPGQELLKGLDALQELYDLFPVTKVCTSNHTARPFRRAYRFGIPKAFLRDYADFMKAPPGWEWRDEWHVDGIKYFHGEGFSGASGALKAAVAFMQSTVIGHLHSWAGINYLANSKCLIFGFNVGCLIDKDAYAMAYSKNIAAKPILGVGVIEAGVPTFIPMKLDAKGRWTGDL